MRVNCPHWLPNNDALQMRPWSWHNRLVLYHRAPPLFEALALARGDGNHGRLLKTLGRVRV